jgi:hypothetical protein
MKKKEHKKITKGFNSRVEQRDDKRRDAGLGERLACIQVA